MAAYSKGRAIIFGLDIRQAQVIVLTSGTKCINGEYINDQGLVVNDCHAEIVARRAFLHFLYSQLELHLSLDGALHSLDQILDYIKMCRGQQYSRF
uniref:Double-stranded RNA-specific editase B2 n=1 Tax=Sphaerodactylus townsendi TaxID=933632 RepID=A0ACB8FW23_9SAUR